jgi:hypothetical protein
MIQSCTPLKSPAHAAPLSNYTNPAVFASCICENASKTDSELILLAGDDKIANDEADLVWCFEQGRRDDWKRRLHSSVKLRRLKLQRECR